MSYPQFLLFHSIVHFCFRLLTLVIHLFSSPSSSLVLIPHLFSSPSSSLVLIPHHPTSSSHATHPAAGEYTVLPGESEDEAMARLIREERERWEREDAAKIKAGVEKQFNHTVCGKEEKQGQMNGVMSDKKSIANERACGEKMKAIDKNGVK